MNCEQAQHILLAHEDRGSAGSTRKRAEQHVAACATCQEHLAGLAAAMNRPAGLCGAVQEMLPLYVEAELTAGDAGQRYPQIGRHLATCAGCAGFLDDLRFALTAERSHRFAAPPAYPPAALPFLPAVATSRPAAPAAASWVVQVQRDIERRLTLLVTISAQYIAQLLAPPQLAWARAATAPRLPATEAGHFPLVVSLLDEESLLLSVEAQRGPAGDTAPRWDLLVTLTGSAPGHEWQIAVTDGAEARTAIADAQGEALFRDVPAAWLSAPETEGVSRELRIEVAQRIP